MVNLNLVTPNNVDDLYQKKIHNIEADLKETTDQKCSTHLEII